MRILFVLLSFISLFIITESTYAESGFQFDQAAIASKYKDKVGNETVLSSNFEGNWSWLLFQVSNRYYLQSPHDNYSCLLTEYQFPKISPDLTFYLGDQWNQSYNITTTMASYQWKLFHNLDLELVAGKNNRNGLKDSNQKYHYSQDSQGIKLDYSPSNWQYQLIFNQKNRNYPDYGYWSAEKTSLAQKVIWKNTDFKIGLGCKEETGRYPNDQAETEQDRNYWKQKWIIDGNKEFGDKHQLNWQYSDSYHIKGFIDPYRTEQRIKIKWVHTPNPKWQYSIQTNYAQLNYATAAPDYYEPGYIPDDDEDDDSRIEKKLNLTLQHRFDSFKIEIGCCFGDYQYSQKETVTTSSLYSSIDWELNETKEYTLHFKIAPTGDQQNRSGYYQLKLNYKPTKQKRESKYGDLDKLNEPTDEDDESNENEENVTQFIEI